MNNAPPFFLSVIFPGTVKRLFTIANILLMLAVLIFQSVGYVVLHKVWIKKHRHEIKSGFLRELPESLLMIIRVPYFQPESVPLEFEHAEEFKLNGEMYDIVRTEIRNDTIYYFTFHDTKESSLYRSLSAAVHHQTSQDQASNPRLQLLLSLGQFLYLDTFQEHVFLRTSTTMLTAADGYQIIESPSFVITPPPKHFLHMI